MQRLCSLLPQKLLHRTMTDAVLDGYYLPAGTCVVPQITTVLEDEKQKLKLGNGFVANYWLFPALMEVLPWMCYLGP